MKNNNKNRIYVYTATTTSQKLFGDNPHRKAFAVKNVGTNNVEFCDTSQAYGQGFPLIPSQIVNESHFNPQGELWVIATGGDTELRVWEILSQE